jgi:hypothetical protein
MYKQNYTLETYILSLYTLNIIMKHLKEKMINWSEEDKSIMIVGYFNFYFS